MKVCYFGNYKQDYSRNRIIIKGLRKAGVEVTECHSDTNSSIKKLYELIKKERKIDYDVMIIGFPGHKIVLFGKIISKLRRKPLIFDAFNSVFDSRVIDRKIVTENSILAKIYHHLDEYSCKMANMVFLDTNSHISYFIEEFGIERDKFRRIFIGADDDTFNPKSREDTDKNFHVIFHGSFIPLQGVQYIVEAAKILEKYEEIKLELIGSGQTFRYVKEKAQKLNLNNTIFRGSVKYDELPAMLAQGDVGLGIFGDTPKASRVIPNKVFELIAMKKAVITRESPAILEGEFEDRKNCLLCRPADPNDLASAILDLYEHPRLRKRIEKNGYDLFKNKFSVEILGRDVESAITELLSSKGRAHG